MKFCTYLLLWVTLFYAPAISGEWYDLRFNVYQSLVSLALILAAIPLMPTSWTKRSMLSVLTLQICLNVTDAFINLTADQYNGTQSVLNSLEMMLCFLWGAGVWSDYYQRRWFPDSANIRNPPNSQRVRARG